VGGGGVGFLHASRTRKGAQGTNEDRGRFNESKGRCEVVDERKEAI